MRDRVGGWVGVGVGDGIGKEYKNYFLLINGFVQHTIAKTSNELFEEHCAG